MPFLRKVIERPPIGSTSYVLPNGLRFAHSVPAALLLALAGLLVKVSEERLPLWGMPAWALRAAAVAALIQGFLYVRFVWRYRVTLSPNELRYDDGLRRRTVQRSQLRRLERTPGPRPLLRFYGADAKKPLLVIPLLFQVDAPFGAFLARLEARTR